METYNIDSFILLFTLYNTTNTTPMKLDQIKTNVIQTNLDDLVKRKLIEIKNETLWITKSGNSFVKNILAIPFPTGLNQERSIPLDEIDQQLISLIDKIDKEEYCAGQVPLDLLIPQAEKKFNLSFPDLRKRLFNLENNSKIYFETINDPSRLVGNQRNYTIELKSRGILFYVGRWHK